MKRVTNDLLAQTIEENFGSFLRQFGFKPVPNGIEVPWASSRVVFYDSPDYRLVFEIDISDDVTVVARSLPDRQRGGALVFLLKFLSGSNDKKLDLLSTQVVCLRQFHAQIVEILSGRDEVTYRAFLQWVELNWNDLTCK